MHVERVDAVEWINVEEAANIGDPVLCSPVGGDGFQVFEHCEHFFSGLIFGIFPKGEDIEERPGEIADSHKLMVRGHGSAGVRLGGGPVWIVGADSAEFGAIFEDRVFTTDVLGDRGLRWVVGADAGKHFQKGEWDLGDID